jgi:hypothetical protein
MANLRMIISRILLVVLRRNAVVPEAAIAR